MKTFLLLENFKVFILSRGQLVFLQWHCRHNTLPPPLTSVPQMKHTTLPSLKLLFFKICNLHQLPLNSIVNLILSFLHFSILLRSMSHKTRVIQQIKIHFLFENEAPKGVDEPLHSGKISPTPLPLEGYIRGLAHYPLVPVVEYTRIRVLLLDGSLQDQQNNRE